MTISVYIRPLVIEDAQVSHVWRNDPLIWVYTGYKPVNYISAEVETEWLRTQLNKTNQARFAICVKELNTYIGNVQLLDITEHDAELHLFIGNKLYWGKGIGYQATVQMLRYGFLVKELDIIYLKVHPANISALSVYEKAGFDITGKQNDLICMSITKSKFVTLENLKL
ncbi:GNAT family protein [Mucilaginibacter sp.]|jgi:diamine N-acetyltransferase|uniref:GNAT family N-acetyltransferase n=1 Tax=Mucilaginibacter sp. TaxID=1882438 RepID=UPI0025FDB112|nr:GNAT family protein [Mucilaginibacter sp.]